MNHKKRNIYQSRLFIGLLSLTVSILSTACSLPHTTLQISNQPTDATDSAKQAIADQAVDNQAIENQTIKEPTEPTPISEIDPADACILNECEVNPAPRTLTIDELNTIATEISPDETLIQDQSFALTLPIIGRADLITTKSQNNKLYLRLRAAPNQYELIYQSHQWTLWDVKAVALENIHQNGDGPDIIVIAEYVTGIGPTGAQPFSVAHVLFNRGDDSFQSDIAVDNRLSDRNANTIDSVIEIVQAENLTRGLQYQEGPP